MNCSSDFYSYAVIGGDQRQVFLCEELATYNTPVTYHQLCGTPVSDFCHRASTRTDAIHSSDIVIFPTPFRETDLSFLDLLQKNQWLIAGGIPTHIKDLLSEKNIHYYDLLDIESLATTNSIATAEGCICEAIKYSSINLHHSKCAILGFGKCGQTLAQKLVGLSAHVTVFSSTPSKRARSDTIAHASYPLDQLLESCSTFDFIFNTIPICYLTECVLSSLSSKTVILDIVTVGDILDLEACKSKDIPAYRLYSLPGIYAPKSSAISIAKIINELVKGVLIL